MPHDHSHEMSPSGHPYRTDDDVPLSYWQQMEIAIREILIEKGVTSAAEIAAQVEAMDARGPANGAALVARAWSDGEFRALLMRDAGAACAQMGFDIGTLKLIALENTENVHNVVVCTLCSCYPRNLLGLPPDWYKSRAYRSRTVREPRRVLAEFGVELGDDVEIRVHDSTADMRYIVIPRRPEGTAGLSRPELAALVGRDAMIGTGLARVPGAAPPGG
ncbi:nitrile hydratase subunit alpha [Profundibacterium mesophilum]|uniref:Nitrile hydratase subunit alpha n=1 Tax=Profundibacterium mesophilum KAUST100406-0324 TaxID=1037889 RepID=A0A921TB38_9RHOB|nr:nitrile hydratase subunit alpha [Profundibacterium mesophilum]KAF0674805.1 Nitrile hydratase subunit alpha [Profundibacterium mesophilum KAUST100406-0324]